MRVFLRCSSVWPIHDRSLALSPPFLAHSCSAMTRKHALRIGVYGSSRGSDSRPSGQVGKFRAGSGGVPILSNCSRSRRLRAPETRFGLQAWPPWPGNLISGRLGKIRTRSARKPALTRGPRRKELCISFISIPVWYVFTFLSPVES